MKLAAMDCTPDPARGGEAQIGGGLSRRHVRRVITRYTGAASDIRSTQAAAFLCGCDCGSAGWIGIVDLGTLAHSSSSQDGLLRLVAYC